MSVLIRKWTRISFFFFRVFRFIIGRHATCRKIFDRQFIKLILVHWIKGHVHYVSSCVLSIMNRSFNHSVLCQQWICVDFPFLSDSVDPPACLHLLFSHSFRFENVYRTVSATARKDVKMKPKTVLTIWYFHFIRFFQNFLIAASYSAHAVSFRVLWAFSAWAARRCFWAGVSNCLDCLQ